MTRSRFLTIAAVLMMILGIGVIAAPELLFMRYGFSLNEPGAFVARLLAAALLALGTIDWMAARSPNSPTMRAILIGNLLFHSVSFLIHAAAILLDITNSQAWGGAAFNLILGAGFVFYLATSRRTSG